MADIALFHSVLGARPGVHDAAGRLHAAGHTVTTVDQYDGRVFDDYEEAARLAEAIGYPTLMQRALEGVVGLPDGFVAIGFSNGGGMAEFVATQRRVSRVVLASGTLPLAMIDVLVWPADTPVQIHYALDDPNRRQEWIDSLVGSVKAAGAPVEAFDYPGRGHLFTDASLPDEYIPRRPSFCGSRCWRSAPSDRANEERRSGGSASLRTGRRSWRCSQVRMVTTGTPAVWRGHDR